MNDYIDKVINADSISAMSALPESFAHLILSDIPYGIGVEDWDVLHENLNTAYMGTSPAQIKAGAILESVGNRLMGGLRLIGRCKTVLRLVFEMGEGVV